MTTKDWKILGDDLNRELGLKHPATAITFSHEAPLGATRYEGEVPDPTPDGRSGKVAAGCVFWGKAVDKTFATRPEDHYNCSVGSVTHGLKTLEEVMDKGDVQAVVEVGWVSAEEAMQLPFVKERPSYITYGPLAETSIDPDVILLRVNAFQAMVIHDGFGDTVFVGKPQCHIIPISKEQGKLAISTGCMLSRVRTGMSPDEMTCTIPSERLEEVVERLKARREANAAVAAYANEDLRRFSEPR
jgi:uncharacterized protein (DUF169 family)